MTRIIVIGPSHVAAFKTAWDKIAARRPEVSVGFFGAPMPIFLGMRLGKDLVLGLDPKHADDGQRDLVERINGTTSIDLKTADIVLRVGYRVMDEAVLETLAAHDVDGLRAASSPHRMSALCFDAILDSLATHSLPPPRWRGWIEPKLVIAGRPLPAMSLLDADTARTPRLATHLEIAERPDGVQRALAAFQDKVAAELAACGIDYLRQPEETISGQGLSLREFALGATRITNGQPQAESDHIHLNDHYGALCFDRLFQKMAIATRSTGRACR